MFACKCKFLNGCCVFANACILMEVNREDELFTLICVKIIELFYQSPFLPCSPSSLQSLLISCLFTGVLFTIMCFQSIYAFNERDCKSIISLYYPASLSVSPLHLPIPHGLFLECSVFLNAGARVVC